MKKTTILLALIMFSGHFLHAENSREITSWLAAGPFAVSYPAFHDTADVEGNAFEDQHLLTFRHINPENYRPVEDMKMEWNSDISGYWQRLDADDTGYVMIDDKGAENPQITYLAGYIRTDRWMEGQLEIKSPYLLKGWLNGEEIGNKTGMETGDNDPGILQHNFQLPKGTHLILVKTVRPSEHDRAWKVSGSITPEEPAAADDLRSTLSPDNIKNIHHLLDGAKISAVRPSPDGSMYAVHYRKSMPPSDQTETWTDIHRFEDDALVHSFRHADVSRISWLPESNAVSYTTTNNGKTTVHYHHMETGEKQVLLEDTEQFAGMQWSPTENYFVYSIRETGNDDNDVMRHILGMQDRLPHFRYRSFLYKYDVDAGVSKRLTHGNLSTSLHDISPDGRQIVFSKSTPDYLERPYYKHHLYLMDMMTDDVEVLLENRRWGVSTQFSPDGRSLLATGGPSAFDGAGENVPEGMIPNNYDIQAYIFSLEDKTANPITIDFAPSVASAHWHAPDNHIYILAGDEDYRRLFRYDTEQETFNHIDSGVDFLSTISYAVNGTIATYTGSQVNAPPKAYSISLDDGDYEVLADTSEAHYRHVRFGEVNDWDFTASTGKEIKGRYHLPPDFDPEETYPVIVYQYGGTNPVSRSFGGRYPFNIWAGNGYIVYVLQPSGATGFGQEFSAAHVNNWGKTVADEIIEGTEKFLEAHPFADPDRVGVSGASYGGFMTMLLLTHTDMYTTGISHAGISNIASYWGEGYWGYSYSAEATAGSFPWDSKDIYVDQSPLYRADHITTPLLLLTGDSDTNVPPGESIQLYTALKLLGRPVELILVEGEDHHILTYSKRIKWHKTMMAWWEKYLKGQPERWETLYPRKNY